MAAFPKFGSAATVMPKALVFDTFGTVVDWRGSIIEEGKAYGKTKGFELDWGDFADRWPKEIRSLIAHRPAAADPSQRSLARLSAQNSIVVRPLLGQSFG